MIRYGLARDPRAHRKAQLQPIPIVERNLPRRLGRSHTIGHDPPDQGRDHRVAAGEIAIVLGPGQAHRHIVDSRLARQLERPLALATHIPRRHRRGTPAPKPLLPQRPT
jgi:hypothetical protein